MATFSLASTNWWLPIFSISQNYNASLPNSTVAANQENKKAGLPLDKITVNIVIIDPTEKDDEQGFGHRSQRFIGSNLVKNALKQGLGVTELVRN